MKLKIIQGGKIKKYGIWKKEKTRTRIYKGVRK